MMVRCIKKVFSVVIVLLLFLVVNIYLVGLIICYGPSPNARDLFVTTFLETGNMKFMVNLFMGPKQIQSIVNKNTMDDFVSEIDESMIDLSGSEDSSLTQNDIELVEISGATYYAKMLIIKDPSRVKLATIYDGSWKEYGKTLDVLVKENDAIAGVNGGLYEPYGNKGGMPAGVVVRDGVIEYNNPKYPGLVLVGFNEDNLLRVIDLSNKNSSEIELIVRENKIRDAVVFQEESSDKNNHFVKLIINGDARSFNGTGSGANPRTVVGQRADGSVLLLVTDGRGANGHIGATAADLIEILEKYGAVNAANIDGGSSSCMYYNDKFEMTSTTLYYTNSSWRLPTSFIVTKDGR